MKPIQFWPWYSLVLLCLLAVSHGTVFYLSLKTKFYKTLAMLSVLSGFCLLENIGQFIIVSTTTVDAHSGNLYASKLEWNFYWTASVIASFIIVLLAVNIVTEVLKLKYVVSIWGLLVVCMLFLAGYFLLPSTQTGNLLMISTLADLAAVLGLLIIGIIPSADWPKGFPLIVAGIAVSVTVDALASLSVRWLHTLRGVFSVGVPVASLIGSCFYISALLLRNRLEKLKDDTPLQRNQSA